MSISLTKNIKIPMLLRTSTRYYYETNKHINRKGGVTCSHMTEHEMDRNNEITSASGLVYHVGVETRCRVCNEWCPAGTFRDCFPDFNHVLPGISFFDVILLFYFSVIHFLKCNTGAFFAFFLGAFNMAPHMAGSGLFRRCG